MVEFPRTQVGGVSLPRLIVGTNWFLGYSHTSLAKDKFIREHQTRQKISAVLETFLKSSIDAVMGPPSALLEEAIQDAEQRAGKGMIRVITPSFNIDPGGNPADEPQVVLDRCKEELHATICMPHQMVTDALLDRRSGEIRELEVYTRMIRERGMIPGLSTHMPETVVIADRTQADVETYIQIYNAAGFLMTVEADWAMRIIQNAHKPVMTIKPLAAGRLLPVVGLSFVWSTIREQDMVTIGVTTTDEAWEVIEISLALLEKRGSEHALQKTRSKQFLG
jgi:hypothetical protein